MNDDIPSRILVIDDDIAIRRSLMILLTAKGHKVFEAEDGAIGFDRFVEHRPGIVISDMVMPGQGGVAMIRKIRKMDPHVLIIAMSGSIRGGPANFLQKALSAGADVCLEKPFDMGQVLALLTTVRA